MRRVARTFAMTFALVASQAEARVGLAPDLDALSTAEAKTASASGSAALFYNPAGLARRVWGLGLSLGS